MADLLSNGLPEVITDVYGKRNVSFLAAAFGALVENGLIHARTPLSPF